jgi:hypothetical protein
LEPDSGAAVVSNAAYRKKFKKTCINNTAKAIFVPLTPNFSYVHLQKDFVMNLLEVALGARHF